MNQNIFTKGDILEATHRDPPNGVHYIIFYEGNSDIDFIGGMITHDPRSENTEMLESHFKQHDNNGEPYKVIYDNSFLVIAKLKKPFIWAPFTKVGQLSDKGFEFIEKNIGQLESETWEEYLYRTKSNRLENRQQLRSKFCKKD